MTSVLPIPDIHAQAHSEALRSYIRDSILQQGGCISFKQFMQLALYAPGLGYYSAGSHKLGEAGDFITAPELSPLFGITLAQSITPALQVLPRANILEVGAGSGALAVSILQTLQQSSCECERYYILEVSADLRERQRQQLQAAGVLDKVVWLEALPQDFVGVVLGNEVLDAMPVNVFEILDSGMAERYVALHEEKFIWQSGAVGDERLLQRLAEIEQQLGKKFTTGYVSEINLAAEDWITTLSAACKQAYVLLIDYGFPRQEYYHPQRQQGTLMCHYRHHSHDDPFQYLGLQDITAHVDFTAIADAALAAGWSVDGYTTQAHFLLASGLMNLLQNDTNDLSSEQLMQQQQVKKLTMPHEMGELFKVIGLKKNIEITLPGFAMRDMRDHL